MESVPKESAETGSKLPSTEENSGRVGDTPYALGYAQGWSNAIAECVRMLRKRWEETAADNASDLADLIEEEMLTKRPK